jgi:hypothetical protein
MRNAIAILIALLAAYAPETGAADWHEVSTNDFVLITDLPEDRARRLLADFAVFRKAVSATLVGGGEAPRVPTYIYAVDGARWRAFGASSNAAGFFRDNDFWTEIVLDYGTRELSARHIIFHEYIHYLLRNNPGFLYPAWYEEGLAELYATVDERDGAVDIGRPNVPRGKDLADIGLAPVGKIMGVDRNSSAFRNHQQGAQFYAQSWLLTHYLLMNGPERQAQLREYLILADRGVPVDKAIPQAFGVSAYELDRQLRRYFRAGRFPGLRLTFADVMKSTAEASFVPLGDLDAELRIGIAAVRTSQGGPEARSMLQNVLRERPQDLLARAGLAMSMQNDGRSAEALTLAQEVLAHGETVPPQARMVATDVLWSEACRDPDAKSPPLTDTERQALLAQAAASYLMLVGVPALANEAAFSYAQAALELGTPGPEEILPIVERALVRLPTSTALLVVEAQAYARAGRKELALLAARRGLERSGTEQGRNWFDKVIAALEGGTPLPPVCARQSAAAGTANRQTVAAFREVAARRRGWYKARPLAAARTLVPAPK